MFPPNDATHILYGVLFIALIVDGLAA